MSDNPEDTDPDKAIVIVGDDGQVYKLDRKDWHKDDFLLTDTGGKGIVNQLAQFGTIMAFVSQDVTGVGVGYACTVVNLKAILEGRKPRP
jgi:hypothetical protein